MWRPPERKKHETKPGAWPSQADAARALLFQPIKIGPASLQQRTWVPAMVPWRATPDGFVSKEVLEWYERFARGKPGAIVVEATGVRDIPSGPLLRIGDDRFLPGLAKLVETVREASDGETKLFIQLIDFLAIRRRPTPEKFFAKHLIVTDCHRKALAERTPEARHWKDERIRAHLASLDDTALTRILNARELEALQMGYRERVTDLHLPQVRELPQTMPDSFAAAAVRAREAGFDGVELHYAHAYTMASFLSALNDRPDGYGGARENRVRLPLEVYERVRESVGDDFVIGCRYLSDDCIEGGNTVDDAIYFGVAFAKAGMDFLSLSRGGKFEDAKQPKVGAAAYPYTGRSGYECMPSYVSDTFGPFGRNVDPVARIRAAVRNAGLSTPIVVSGGIHGFQQAEELLVNNKADIVGFARQALADPDWFLKVRLGQGDAVRVCRYTNYCEALDQKHAQVTCELWDREALSAPDARLSTDGKRRLTAPNWRSR